MINLTGKHIFIAGGSRGIGAATARMAASAGAAVSINYAQSADRAEALVAEIAGGGGKSFAVRADVAEEGALEQATDQAVGHLGPLTGLVVSAGVFEGAWLQDMTAAFWDRTMAINVRGTFLAVRAAVRQMRQNEHRRGKHCYLYFNCRTAWLVQNIRSYATSKGAQIMFMRSMANGIGPGQNPRQLHRPRLDGD